MSNIQHLPVTFRARKEFVEAVFHAENQQTISIRLESPEQILEFFQRLMEMAVVVWPENKWIQEYLSDD